MMKDTASASFLSRWAPSENGPPDPSNVMALHHQMSYTGHHSRITIKQQGFYEGQTRRACLRGSGLQGLYNLTQETRFHVFMSVLFWPSGLV